MYAYSQFVLMALSHMSQTDAQHLSYMLNPTAVCMAYLVTAFNTLRLIPRHVLTIAAAYTLLNTKRGGTSVIGYISRAYVHTLIALVSGVQEGQPVDVSWTVMFLGGTDALQDFTQHLPDWVASTAMTTFQSSWTWPGSL